MNVLEQKLAILQKFLVKTNRINHIPENGEILFQCINPKCQSRRTDKNKFCVNLIKNAAHCWVCDLRFKNIDFLVKKHAPAYLQKWNAISGKKFNLEIVEKPKEFYDGIFNEFYQIKNLRKSHPAIKYLNERGVTDDEIRAFDIRYVDAARIDDRFIRHFVCIPSHTPEGIDYLFFRSLEGNYKLNTKFDKKKIIFNELFINWKREVFLTEGIFDALKIFRFSQAVPLLGCSLSEDSEIFKKILAEKPNVVVCLDPEAIERQIQIMDMLHKWGINVFSMETQRTDLGASTDEEIIEAMKNIKQFDKNFKIKRSLYL